MVTIPAHDTAAHTSGTPVPLDYDEMGVVDRPATRSTLATGDAESATGVWAGAASHDDEDDELDVDHDDEMDHDSDDDLDDDDDDDDDDHADESRDDAD